MRKKICLYIILLILLCSCSINYQNKLCNGCNVTYCVVNNIDESHAYLEKKLDKTYAIVELDNVESNYVISTFDMKVTENILFIYLKRFDVNKNGSTYDLIISIELSEEYYKNIKEVKYLWNE